MRQPQPHRSTLHMLKTTGIYSVSDLQHWCATNDGSVFGETIGSEFVSAPLNSQVRYPVTPTPVCLWQGTVYTTKSSSESEGKRVSPFDQGLRSSGLSVAPLTDAFFTSKPVTTIPAMALLVYGDFIARHVFHLIHDVLESLYILLHTYQGGALLRVPRQTVLFRSPDTDWLAAEGKGGHRQVGSSSVVDPAKGTALSAQVLNGFSFALDAGEGHRHPLSFFTSSLVFEHGKERVPLSPNAFCFCQGMFVSPKTPSTPSSEVYKGIRRAVSSQFPNERGYRDDLNLANESADFPSFVEEEKDRRERRLPYGSKYWQEHAGGEKDPGVYRPRALLIHRASRRIANVVEFTRMLREEGFRVEEVYLERIPVSEQYHLGRYADLVVGMHGLGLVHGLWMESSPEDCRAVLEFMPWVHAAFPFQFKRLFGDFMNMSYHQVMPKDVSFDLEGIDAVQEKKRLMDIRNVVSAFQFPTFAYQTCIYDEAEVRAVMHRIRQRLDTCLYSK